MFTRVHPVIAAAIVVSCLQATLSASASDPVLEWNQIAVATTAVQGAVPQVRSMAIVQTAVHDAVNAITGRYETYSPMGAAPAGASVDAAVIAAAHHTLSRLFPSQAGPLATLRAASLAAHSLTEADPGIAVGEAAGAAILALRANDGAAQANFPYVAPGAGLPGVWVAIGTAPPATPGWGRVVPWVLRSGSQFLPDAPPALDSGRYARDVEEVKALGALNNHSRTMDQTRIADFWRGSPAAIWNGVATGVVTARGLDQSSTARTFALLYLASADASIVCWNAKYTYNFWRPQAAIVNADVDGNDATVADPSWLPLFPTPPHPEYPSGHTSNSGAMAKVLSLLFGDDPGVPITATSPTTPTFPRAWGTFTEGVDEVIDARIYSGFHFRTADDVGAKLGRQVARFVVNHTLRRR